MDSGCCGGKEKGRGEIVSAPVAEKTEDRQDDHFTQIKVQGHRRNNKEDFQGNWRRGAEAEKKASKSKIPHAGCRNIDSCRWRRTSKTSISTVTGTSPWTWDLRWVTVRESQRVTVRVRVRVRLSLPVSVTPPPPVLRSWRRLWKTSRQTTPSPVPLGWWENWMFPHWPHLSALFRWTVGCFASRRTTLRLMDKRRPGGVRTTILGIYQDEIEVISIYILLLCSSPIITEIINFRVVTKQEDRNEHL